MLTQLQSWFTGLGLSELQAIWLARLIGAVSVLIGSVIAHFITRRIFLGIVHGLAEKTRTHWDDVLIKNRVFHRLAHLAPAIVIRLTAPQVFEGATQLTTLVEQSTNIYMLVIFFSVLSAVLDSVNDIYQEFPVSHRIPIKGYLQVVQIVVGVGIGILIVSTLTQQSPWGLFTGLGALTAVLLLVFRDTILGLVAGIQLVSNDMVRPGDWIEMPKYGADGSVIDIALTTVKVQNWDMTITTIPTYALISDSFKNWRGMSESGGRRIKRSVLIDVTSVRFCSPEMIHRFRNIQFLRDYIDKTEKELADYNKEHGIDESVLVNGRRMTNLGTFRAYLVEYLKRHPNVHQDMTFLVRQLQSNEKGLPLEIYVFSNDQVWANYEAIQADIFDHVFASLPQFDLRPYQYPSSFSGQAIAPPDEAGAS